MNKDFYELNDALEAEKESILAEAYEAELAEENRKQQEFENEVEAHPERFVERSGCCNAELYDDNEFCVECYKRDPEVVYVRKEDLVGV